MSRMTELREQFQEKARMLVSQMTLAEKVYLLSGRTSIQKITDEKRQGKHFNHRPYPAGGNKALGVPELRFCDGPRGVVCGVGKSTCFPVSIMRGASFDTELEEEIGRAMGREARAYGANVFGGACVNLPYHPGWGRNQETYGEDSFAIGSMGAALVRGIQSQGVVAAVKHFAMNSMEDNRFNVSVLCDPRTEREVLLPHFKDCIDAGAGAVMTAFNKVDGEICGQSKHLLSEVLKQDWKFDGVAFSDFFWGINDTKKAITAGLDLEMSDTRVYGKRLTEAVESGRVSEALVEESAVRIVQTALAAEALAEEIRAEDETAFDDSVIGCYEHQALALKAAEEGIVLLKNENKLLPLSKDLMKIAVIGELAAAENLGDFGSSRVYPKHVVTILSGIMREAQNSEVIYYDGQDLDHVARVAAESDVVIYVVGMRAQDEGEYTPPKTANFINVEKHGGDRHSLSLHTKDQKIIEKGSQANPNGVVVLIGGGTILLSEWETKVPAVLQAFYPGQGGGIALAEILFGELSPSGKLPFVLPKSEEDLPFVDWNAEEQKYEYYHGYRLLEKEHAEIMRPYGFGLSYTSFEIGEASFTQGDTTEVKEGSRAIRVSVQVKNTGRMKGAEVVQVYAGFSHSQVERPVKTLVGFQRAELAPGEERIVEILCPISRLEYYEEKKNAFVLEEMEYEFYVGNSSGDENMRCYSVKVVV